MTKAQLISLLLAATAMLALILGGMSDGGGWHHVL